MESKPKSLRRQRLNTAVDISKQSHPREQCRDVVHSVSKTLQKFMDAKRSKGQKCAQQTGVATHYADAHNATHRSSIRQQRCRTLKLMDNKCIRREHRSTTPMLLQEIECRSATQIL
ncbi:unnamed protein product [Citrullus colocynthis]|uniref:Uncharacterized protein n=1 Tax=Citrullus colocynthis TaxID=252529 RepID=A0ABP0YZD8_9ROSI